LRDIEEQLEQTRPRDGASTDELRNLAAAEAGYRTEREAWEALLRERDDLLEAQCTRLTQSSGDSIRAQVKRHADSGDFVDSLKQSLSGSRVQGAKIESLGESISGAPDSGVQWNAILGDLETLAEFDVERDQHGAETGYARSYLGGVLLPGIFDRIARSLKPEAWLSLSLTPIKSVPVFEYRAREKRVHSLPQCFPAGQQATALLKDSPQRSRSPR